MFEAPGHENFCSSQSRKYRKCENISSLIYFSFYADDMVNTNRMALSSHTREKETPKETETCITVSCCVPVTVTFLVYLLSSHPYNHSLNQAFHSYTEESQIQDTLVGCPSGKHHLKEQVLMNLKLLSLTTVWHRVV